MASIPTYNVQVRIKWWARVLLHMPFPLRWLIPVWLVRRGISLNGERMDRACARLKVK